MNTSVEELSYASLKANIDVVLVPKSYSGAFPPASFFERRSFADLLMFT
jgi:hypothetical protein